MNRKNKTCTIKGNVLKNSLLLLLVYAMGLILIFGEIFPKHYIEQQKQLNSDILVNASLNLQDILENVYQEYVSLEKNSLIKQSLEEIRDYVASSKGTTVGDNIKYINAYTALNQNRSEKLFLASKTISDLYYVIGDSIVYPSIDSEILALKNYIVKFPEDEIVFFCTSDVADYGGRDDEFLVCFPIKDTEGNAFARACFILNNDKEYVVWGEEYELVLLNDKNQIMFSSGAINEMVGEVFELQEDKVYEGQINEEKYLIANEELNFYQWKIVYILSLEPFEQTIEELLGFVAAALAVVFALAFFLMGNMSRAICYNIEYVSVEMDNFLGEPTEYPKCSPLQKKMNTLLNKFHMNTKLWFYYLSIMIGPMILISVIVYGKYQHVIQEEIDKNAKVLSDYSYHMIENRLYDETYTLQTILVDSQLMANLHQYSFTDEEEEKKELYYDICVKLQKIAKDSKIIFFDKDRNFVFSWPKLEGEMSGKIDIRLDHNEKTVWNKYNNRYVFYMVRRMYQRSRDYVGYAGYITLEIPEDILFGSFKNGNQEIFYEIADKNNVIFSTNKETRLGKQLIEKSDQKDFYSCRELGQYGIKVAVTVLDGQRQKLSHELLWLIVCWTILMGIVACVQERKNYKKIITPIHMVNRALLKDDEIDLTNQSGDEVDKLILSVDQMKKRINSLFEKVYENEVVARELEMKVLRAQITPHFLCNTLERINALIDMQDDRAGDLVVLLGKLFRMGISQEQQFITLEEEIAYTKVYIKIHKIILEDKLEISWEIPEKMRDYQTVHFILQPLVENCLKHGKYLNNDCRRIVIRGYEKENCLLIAVADNGRGISKQRLKKIRDNIKGEYVNENSKGLKNVHDRIRLTYGEEYGLRIYSIEEKGAIVFMKIPKIKED